MASGWTQIKHTVGTTSDLAADVNAKQFAGVIITTDGTASLSILKTGTTAGSGTEVMRFLIEAVTGGTTRYFPMPGFLELTSGFNLDIDTHVTNFTILHN